MRLFFCLCYILLFSSTTLSAQEFGEIYISEWKNFYPSKALKSGLHTSVFHYENRASEVIANWLKFNENVLLKLSEKEVSIDSIDGRLLRVQAQSEVDKWSILAEHTTSLQMYSMLIANAIPSLLEADYLLNTEKSKLLCIRLESIRELASAGRSNLKAISKSNLENGLKELSKSLGYLQNELLVELKGAEILNSCENFDKHLSEAVQSVEALLNFGNTTLQKTATNSKQVLGREEYDRRLQLYADSDLTSKKLAEMALVEIETVKKLMADVSKKYILDTNPNQKLPLSEMEAINLALADMEKDAPLNSTDYLEFWQELARVATDFIATNDIATLPKNQTLQIQTAPESAGAAARIGWVASAPPFDPNPMTVLNLPSIPDTLPKQEQIDFWASFNKPFNRMIVIHELFPGHYMQLKISRETPHPIRLLFPYGIYIEGWATFTEKVLLDAGWEKDSPLTLLAHLRKRLENANRAYTSVQVHCNSWDKDKVLTFSTETSLLAPQFAKSLWGRIINSPLQLTSYYLGGTQFTELLEAEKKRLGASFNLRRFMDTIMKAGPIPIDEFYAIFKYTNPN